MVACRQGEYLASRFGDVKCKHPTTAVHSRWLHGGMPVPSAGGVGVGGGLLITDTKQKEPRALKLTTFCKGFPGPKRVRFAPELHKTSPIFSETQRQAFGA